MLPVQFNDGKPVPRKWIGEAVREIAAAFDAASFETQRIEGFWRRDAVFFRDNLVRLTVDLPDTAKNRKWLKGFKVRWRERLRQLEIWMVSYEIRIE